MLLCVHLFYTGGKAFGQLKDEQQKALEEINEVFYYTSQEIYDL